MGIYSEYLDKQLSFDDLIKERKNQLKSISDLRNREVLVFAADLNKKIIETSINYTDLLPISDQISNLNGSKIDVIIETPGGSGEVAEDIVRLLRNRFKEVNFIIPGWAKSAGTILVLSGDSILMGQSSALGPIDAQLSWQGKHFSAHALLESLKKIKDEVIRTGVLNKAYIPILSAMSPGEIENADNALNFAKELVKKWLVDYKFRTWIKHSSNNQIVTQEEKEKRANEIATVLCDHGHWKTHGRSIKIDDLEKMRVLIDDYSKNEKLNKAITRYYTLLQMTFATNIYKIFETQNSQIYRFIVNQPIPPFPINQQKKLKNVIVNFECPNCKNQLKIQANLEKGQKLLTDHIPFPKSSKLICPNCKAENDLSDARRQIEAQTKKTILL